jgi:trehalose-6-phosphate synthase
MQPWTKDSLHELVSDRLRGLKLIVVSNREPYIHCRQGYRTVCMRAASGLTTALDPILQSSGGVWIAHGSGDADRDAVDFRDHVRVPPGNPSYTLRRVWLPRELEAEYYYGLANQGLWPLCHIAFQRPHYTRENWRSYEIANRLFADAVLEEADGEPAFVFIQDYHFGLLPRMLKLDNPNLVVAHFWHIPWPNREAFRTFPWKEDLLDGMLGNDLLGFHLRYHAVNFLETVDSTLETLVDTEHGRVTRGGHVTQVKDFPISIDFAERSRLASGPGMTTATAEWIQELGDPPEMLGIGVDRIDYTKGIPERLRALDLLLEEHPEYIGRLTFVQIGVPSRTAIADYGDLNRRLAAQVDALNARWARGAWRPVVFVRRHVDQHALIALHLMADFCVVSSLHDGMNLVAKEFVASRIDGDGVLILSAFTGAARELADALIINPFSPEEIADAMHRALTMPAEERFNRMNRMRTAVAGYNVYRWASEIIRALTSLDAAEAAGKFRTYESSVKSAAEVA